MGKMSAGKINFAIKYPSTIIKHFSFPLPGSQEQAKIKGYLMGIKRIISSDVQERVLYGQH